MIPMALGRRCRRTAARSRLEAVLDEIFRQRRAELFLHGTGWEDSRRLGQPGPSANMFERNRDFYPYADQERLNNPNTPADPAQ